MMISKAAAIAALLAGGSAIVTAMPASAQTRSGSSEDLRRDNERRQNQAAQPAQPAQGQRRMTLSRTEERAIKPLIDASTVALNAQQAGQTPNWAPVRALLPAAQAAARGNDARYLISKVQYLLARADDSIDQQEQVLAAIAANPSSPPDEVTSSRAELSRLKNVRAERAFNANDFATAERIYLELQQANPTDTRIANNLAIIRGRMGNVTGALEPLLQQIRTAEASGGRADEGVYRRVRDQYYTSRDGAHALEFATKLARNYPTGANWRDAILMYRQFNRPGPELSLATHRLQRAAGALQGEADYLDYARIVRSGGYAGEAKAVVEAGISANAYTRQRQDVPEVLRWAEENIARDRTGLDREIRDARAGSSAVAPLRVGDALYGYGRYAEAADLYRAALTKTGGNRDLINLHLGAALAMANQRAEAEAALRAVTGQPAGVAALWLAWLGRSRS